MTESMNLRFDCWSWIRTCSWTMADADVDADVDALVSAWTSCSSEGIDHVEAKRRMAEEGLPCLLLDSKHWNNGNANNLKNVHFHRPGWWHLAVAVAVAVAVASDGFDGVVSLSVGQ